MTKTQFGKVKVGSIFFQFSDDAEESARFKDDSNFALFLNATTAYREPFAASEIVFLPEASAQ